MLEGSKNVLKIVVEDKPTKFRISSGPTSVGAAKKIVVQMLGTEKCTPAEVARILPEFEKELIQLEAKYPEVEVEVLVDDEYINIKLRDLAKTIERNVPLERSSL